MSKDVILKIRDAENKAKKIKEAAATQSKNMIKDADAAGKKLCEDTETSCDAENAAKLRIIQEKADELIAKSREKAEEDAARTTADAEVHLREAIRYIVGGVTEKCQ